jgi:hypothetical protein
MGGMFGFLRSFGVEKLGQVGDTITQKIVAWDPETASQAEIEEMIKELDRITAEAGKAQALYNREQTEADAAKKNFDRYMSAAELLHKQLDEAQQSANETRAAEIGKSLEKLLNDLEEMRPEVEREAVEAEEAKAYLDEVKQLAELTASKVKNARAMLDKSKMDMKRAELEQERARTRAERAEHVAGLRKESSSLGVALAAMNKQAEEARAKASASDMKAKLLSPDTPSKDDAIEAALKAVSGQTEPEKTNFADRLAALRKK